MKLDASVIHEKSSIPAVSHIQPDNSRDYVKTKDSSHDTTNKILGDGFELTGIQTQPKEFGTKQALKELAVEFNEACNGGFLGLGIETDKAKKILKELNADEFVEFDQIFATEFGAKYAAPGERWGVQRQLESEHSELWSWNKIQDRDYRLLKNLVETKKNEVPTEFRVNGQELLKPGSELHVGEITNVHLPNGREYGVYIPKNADSRAVVIVGLKGAGIGETKNTLAEENGITQYAENFGTIVVLPQSKPRQFKMAMGMSVTGTTWNVPGYTNLPVEGAENYDDRAYLNDVLSDLSKRALTSKRVGLLGHSDGARFAQIYAAQQSDKVAAVLAIHGTTMAGDPAPVSGTPIKIVHALGDTMLPWSGGMGRVSARVNAALSLGTNLAKSTPYLQPEIWRAANHCSDKPEVAQNAESTTLSYRHCQSGEVIVELKRNGNHSIDDRLNDAAPNELWDSYTGNSSGSDIGDGMRWLKSHVIDSSKQLMVKAP